MSIGAPYRHDVNNSEHLLTTATLTLQLEDADELTIDGNGSARTVELPVAANGARVTVINAGGETITVTNPGLTTTNGVIATLEIGVFHADGTVWNHMTGVA